MDSFTAMFFNATSTHCSAGVARCLATLCFVLLTQMFTPAIASHERRMAIEIDHNIVRYAIADVDASTDTIYRNLDEGILTAGFYAELSSRDDQLYSDATIKKAQRIFLKLRARKEHYSVSKVRAMTTKTFHKANNAQELADKVKRVSGIYLQFLTPEQESRLQFFSTLKAAVKPGTIVWNIGHETLQLMTTDSSTGPIKHNSDTGSVSFLSYLKEVVQNKPAAFAPLLPISLPEIRSGIRFARHLAQKVPLGIKVALTADSASVVGIGKVFDDCLAVKSNGDERAITKADLYQHILQYEKINRHNNPPRLFSESDLANAILMYGFMDALNIDSVELSNHSSAVRMLEISHLWY